MTGVEVMPITGTTWSQPCGPLGVSPEPSRDTRPPRPPHAARPAMSEVTSVAAKQKRTETLPAGSGADDGTARDAWHGVGARRHEPMDRIWFDGSERHSK